MRRMLVYRGSRLFLVWLAVDVAASMVLAAAAGPAYVEWRSRHPELLLLTLAPLAWLMILRRRGH